MTFKNYFLLGLVALMALAACKKTSTPKPGTSGTTGTTGSTGTTNTQIDTDVYVVGTTYITGSDHAQHLAVAYWKNGGSAVVLSKNSTYDYTATAAFASGNDIYVAGSYTNSSGYGVAVYWNTQASEKELKGTTTVGATDSFPNGIAVNSTGNVYVSGTIDDAAGNHAAYWIDGGTDNSLTVNNSLGNGVAVDGMHFYIAGTIAGKATYWKDGDKNNPVNLSTVAGSHATSIAVGGTNIYILGDVPGTPYTQPVIWNKNASTIITPGFLADGSQSVYAIAANSTDVYAAGLIATGLTLTSPVYWKNNTDAANTHILTGKTGSYIGVAVVGNDVYTTGNVSDPGVAYYKNGVLRSGALAGVESVTAIAVATHPH